MKWFDHHRRDLPWRHTRDPYAILVSEVMLQQTQVDRVIPYWQVWMKRWPSATALATAPLADVIRAWKGLGYNRRAVNLQRAAQAVIDRGGEFPRSVSELQKLPGIGPYTAGAIACFAYEQDVAFIDTNMRRVLHRLFFGVDFPKPTVSDREILDVAEAVLPTGQGWLWNQAIMEFGAVHCTARKPLCVICPLQQQCAAFPNIHKVLAASPRSANERTVPFEQTNRYFRGRIMDALREHEGEGVELAEVGSIIRADFSNTHYPWLLELVQALERDGLLVIGDPPPIGKIAEEQTVYDAIDVSALRIRLP